MEGDACPAPNSAQCCLVVSDVFSIETKETARKCSPALALTVLTEQHSDFGDFGGIQNSSVLSYSKTTGSL